MKARMPTASTGLTSVPSQSSTTSSLLHPRQHFIRHLSLMYPKYQQSWHHLDHQHRQLFHQQFHNFPRHQHKSRHQYHQPQGQQDHHIPPPAKHHRQPPKAEKKKCPKEKNRHRHAHQKQRQEKSNHKNQRADQNVSVSHLRRRSKSCEEKQKAKNWKRSNSTSPAWPNAAGITQTGQDTAQQAHTLLTTLLSLQNAT